MPLKKTSFQIAAKVDKIRDYTTFEQHFCPLSCLLLFAYIPKSKTKGGLKIVGFMQNIKITTFSLPISRNISLKLIFY